MHGSWSGHRLNTSPRKVSMSHAAGEPVNLTVQIANEACPKLFRKGTLLLVQQPLATTFHLKRKSVHSCFFAVLAGLHYSEGKEIVVQCGMLLEGTWWCSGEGLSHFFCSGLQHGILDTAFRQHASLGVQLQLVLRWSFTVGAGNFNSQGKVIGWLVEDSQNINVMVPAKSVLLINASGVMLHN